MNYRKSSGSVMVEYIVGVAVLMFAMFFVPFEGVSLVEYLYEAFKRSYQAFLYALSIPI